MSTPISTAVTTCLDTFRQIQARAENPDHGHDGEISLSSWTDELGRLQVWIDNTQADRTGQYALEVRLAKKSYISQHVLQLLRNLNQSLTEALDQISEASSSASEDDALSDTSSCDTTDLQELHGVIVSNINNLNLLSRLIRECASAIPDNSRRESLEEDDEE